MELLRFIVRNIFRNRLRSILTIAGVTVALLSFCMLRTLVTAWYAGVNASAPDRLVTRNKVSLIYPLPVSYRNKILQVRDVAAVAHGVWYGGIYKDKKNFFAQFAVSGSEYLNLYPEFLLSNGEKLIFDKERNACIAGRKLVKRFGWRIGDVITLQGTIFPGNIELVLRGVYRGAKETTDETAFFFRYEYLNERNRAANSTFADKAGWFVVKIKDPDRSAEVSQEIDTLFQNSLAETLTETEKAFQLGFVAMTDAIVTSLKVISIVVIGIILIILANTMAMTARERSSEYAVLKTLGFRSWFLFRLIAGESLVIAIIGGIGALVLSFPAARVFQAMLEQFVPVFEVESSTLLLIAGVALFIGIAAALPPAWRSSRIPIADGLRHMG
ncbi:MAG: ABC transporter permease [Desulfomonile sp.]|nr:ABC transporter permease [Desulfomonile sp.]